MQFVVDGHSVYAATGGRPLEPGRPCAVFLHGAGMDHTVWALQSRWLAFHGWSVLSVDLPGHGESAGSPLPSIGALADWVVALLDVARIDGATLVGHSMGSLIALEAAARSPERVRGLILVGTAPSMPVHQDLLDAAQRNDHAAVDMVNLWGHGQRAGLGSSRAPGVWMTGVGERILERAAPGVLHADLAACNDYKDGLASAARVRVPALLVCGEKDQMTPLRNARALASALKDPTLVVLKGAGHMLLAERPDEVLRAMAEHLAPSGLARA